MRQVISFTLKEELIKKLGDRIKDNSAFRSRSHLMELALERYLEEHES